MNPPDWLLSRIQQLPLFALIALVRFVCLSQLIITFVGQHIGVRLYEREVRGDIYALVAYFEVAAMFMSLMFARPVAAFMSLMFACPITTDDPRGENGNG